MLRLPPFEYHRPESVPEAVGLLAEHGDDAMPIAGGTDLIPNMKHRLFTPSHLVALGWIPELKGFERRDGVLSIGAGESLTAVATHPYVRSEIPALAEAAAHVAGPQLRNRGTLGGNLCLDTRCTYYNQTEFWRRALGYCLKKDGTVCHVTRVGKKCVAAHSADTPPVLITVDAEVEIAGADAIRRVPVAEFFVADGVQNTIRKRADIITRIRIPIDGRGGGGNGTEPGDAAGARPPLLRHTAYAKLRQRGAVDFPLLTVAVAAWLDADGRVDRIRGVVTALGARPRELSGWGEIAGGRRLDDHTVDALAKRAHRQCTPLENHITDAEWRKAMVPVQVRRALRSLRPGSG